MGQLSSQWADRDYYFYSQTEKVVERGLVVGGQAGYNIQCGMALYGIETDFNWANISTNESYYSGYPSITNEVNWFGTTRLRAGIVAGDRLLLYVTGGLAYADIDNKTFYYGSYVGGDSGTKFGWTAGFGVEVAHWDRMTIKAEALYMDFGQETYWDTGHSYRFDHDNSMWVTRLGINFKLGERERVPMK
jgi:outer membrane immunogenic protein